MPSSEKFPIQGQPSKETEKINEELEDQHDRKALERALEEALAQIPREQYAKDFFADAAGKLFHENRELAELATKDHLTGLHNRKGFEEEIAKVLAEINSKEQHKRKETIRNLTIGHFDIDEFKEINDLKGGHAAGDKVLVEVAEYFKKKVRLRDIVARFGGDEIIIAFPGADEETVLRRFGFDPEKSTNAKIEIAVPFNGGVINATLSGGLAEYRPGEKIEDAIARADKALYLSKQGGRNRIAKFEEAEKKEEG